MLARRENYRVAADARLNNREALLAHVQTKLIGWRHCASASRAITDAELIAAAYALWGDGCVQYLQGDFAFVLWDARRHRLFGACSPMGLRSFVYHISESSGSGRRLLCASEPRQLLEDPSVSRELNDAWVAVWLTGSEERWDETIYRGIQRLTPGHCLSADGRGVRITPFWSPSPREMLRLPTQEACTEQFRSLFAEVIRDCLSDSTSDRTFLFDLSGGLDSSSIVAMAAALGDRKEDAAAASLHCFHTYDDSSPAADSRSYVEAMQRQYSRLVVHALPFREHLHGDGAFDALPWLDVPNVPMLLLASFYRQQWAIAREVGTRVHLRGDFGDELLAPSLGYLTTLWRERHFTRLAGELYRWRQVCGASPLALVERWLIKPALREFGQGHALHHGVNAAQAQDAAPWLRPEVWRLSVQCAQQGAEYFRKAWP